MGSDVDKIDFISLSADGNEVELTISDALDWSDEESHLAFLQAKTAASGPSSV
jgi:hypothetical protein